MGTTSLITGASQGIGAAIAKILAAQPHATLALVARNADNLKVVAEACRALGARAETFPCDLTQDAEVEAMSVAVQQQCGVPDLLVNNAGRFDQSHLLGMAPSEFRAVIEVNLTSAFLVTRAFVEPMMQRGNGSIFFMASVASQRAYAAGGAYSVAKHGLLGLARAVRESTKTSGLRVTAIMPGATDSPSWQEALPERMMPAEDIARAVLSIYQLSDRSVVEEIVLRPTGGDI